MAQISHFAHANFISSLWLAPYTFIAIPVYLGHFYFIYICLYFYYTSTVSYFNESRAYLRCLSVFCLPISTRFLFYKWYISKFHFGCVSVFTQKYTKRFVVKQLVVFWLFCSCCINVSPSTDSHSAFLVLSNLPKKKLVVFCCKSSGFSVVIEAFEFTNTQLDKRHKSSIEHRNWVFSFL